MVVSLVVLQVGEEYIRLRSLWNRNGKAQGQAAPLAAILESALAKKDTLEQNMAPGSSLLFSKR